MVPKTKIRALLFGILSLSWIVAFEAPCSEHTLRIFTWQGYVLPEEVEEVNQILKAKGYAYTVSVISPWAEGAQQMFDVIREGKCDVAFLTLFFIKMQYAKTAKLLRPIDVSSPRLTNFKYLFPILTRIPMGMENDTPLYIPWGGGAYGFYGDMSKLKKRELPTSIRDLWKTEWKGRFSLNLSQPWYNLGLVMMSLGKPPFYINELFQNEKRREALELCHPNGEIQKKLTLLYKQAGHLWTHAPEFRENLQIVSSWGPEIKLENDKGGKWQFIPFEEGSMVWLDTISFVKELSGKKLEAAEIFANYYIGKKVQNRIVSSLSMIAASSLSGSNTIIDQDPEFFINRNVMPPLHIVADNLVQQMTERALDSAGINSP